MQNERDKYIELKGRDQEDLDPSSGAGIPFEVIKMCVTRGITRKDQRNGKHWFSSSDIEKMKLIHAIVLHVKVQSALMDCYRIAKFNRVVDATGAQLPDQHSELVACARELIDLGIM